MSFLPLKMLPAHHGCRTSSDSLHYRIWYLVTCCLIFVRLVLNKSGRVWVLGNANGVCALAMKHYHEFAYLKL